MAKLRNAFLLVVGMVLGLVAALGGLLLAHVDSRPPAPTPFGESTDLLVEVFDRVRSEYVDGVDDRRLVESAIRGIVADLDEHSGFLDAGQYEDIRISTSGHYSGIGLDVQLEEGKLTVVAPLDDAPAARAGIQTGDVVVSVDDVPVSQEDLAGAVDRMRGAAGTEVTLAVVRPGSPEPLLFAVTRAEIQVKTVTGKYLNNGLAYVRLAAFADSTPGELAATAARLTGEAGGTLRGLVLDLRSNPGGVLDSAVAVADAFLREGVIVSGMGRGPHARFEQHARAGGVLEGVPAVVLVNGGSASAAEIVAGALKDHGRARIVGERTYGKGSVQTVMPLSEGAAIKLTTSRYMTPAGRTISGRGIDPDVVVPGEQRRRYRGEDGPGSVPIEDDAQLLEALRLVSYESIQISQIQ